MRTLAKALRRAKDSSGIVRTITPTPDGPRIMAIVDTAVASQNSGDEIIMDAVDRHLRPLTQGMFVRRVASHEVLRSTSRRIVDSSVIAVVGGTSIIGARMFAERVWRVSPVDAFARRQFVLMGGGWKGSSTRTTSISGWMLRRVLSRDHLHSVRDEFTRKQMQALGFENVVNTGCPTVWDLDQEHCAEIPHDRAASVVVVLNYNSDPPGLGRKLLAYCLQTYDTVYFWPQSPSDHHYVAELPGGVIALSPGLDSFDRLLFDSNHDVDYVGTRLHGGVRAMQAKRRSVIIEIDHRASGMGESSNLPTVPAGDWEGLTRMVESPMKTEVQLDQNAIRSFKESIAAAVSGEEQ